MTMSSTNTINDINKSRKKLMDQYEELMKTRSQRSMHITRKLNKKIDKLATEIHEMTIKHREEIKKYYSVSQTSRK